ncbi:hypothetical protein MML48_8g00003416 [Holotrichia oblita]|uniref:Uncharacterized protein n=2 Tax=Holotrichia oblita TaxID=644536 RepID=A0ACB9SSJ7_HOLOL|nr:hypothetical protein MML48_8g00003416 [Holotrichia oblita]
MSLSEKDCIEILMKIGYGDRRRSTNEVRELFNQIHPDRTPQSTVCKIIRKYKEHGHVKNLPKSGRPKLLTEYVYVENFERVCTSKLGELASEYIKHFYVNNAEIEARMVRGDRCAGAMNELLKAKNISWTARIQLYRTIIRPTVTYGRETWVMNKREAEKLEVWERKIFRRIFGGRKVNDHWERRSNQEIMRLYGEATVTQFVRAQLIRWLGHMQRREDHQIAKKILVLRSLVNKKEGRLKTRWLQAVEMDLQEKGIVNWREKAMNREQWRQITKQWA